MSLAARWLQRLQRCEDLALTGLLFLLILLAAAQIAARVFAGAGFLWADGLLRALVLWTAMFGAMAAARDGKHLAVDLVPHLSNPLFKRIAGVVARGFGALISAALAWYCLQLVQLEREDGALMFLSVPTWVVQLVLPFGFSVMTLRFLRQGVVALLKKHAA